jgi:hypothetical protein
MGPNETKKKEHGLNHTLSCFYCFVSAFKKSNASLLFSISYPSHFSSKALESNPCNTTTAYPLGVYGLRYHLSSTLVLILKYQKQIRLPVFHHQYQDQTAIKKRDQPKSVSILFFIMVYSQHLHSFRICSAVLLLPLMCDQLYSPVLYSP